MTSTTMRQLAHRRANLERLGAIALLDRIAREHGVSQEEILGESRPPSIVRARHRFWSLLYGTFGLGLAEIGRCIGRDHTTIMHALTKREAELRP